MDNIIEFPSRPGRTIDATALQFESIERLRSLLVDSLEWDDPTLLMRVYCTIAHGLLANNRGEASAVAEGRASLVVSRERGLDIIKMIAELPGTVRPPAK